MTDNNELPEDWDAARPVITAFMAGSLNRRSEIDGKIDTLTRHIDSQFDGLRQVLTVTTATQIEHAETLKEHVDSLKQHEESIHRLHDQQQNLLAANNILLTNFGKILGDLSERVHKGEYVAAFLVIATCVGVGILTLLALRLL